MLLVLFRLAVMLVPAQRLLAWAARPPAHPRRFTDPKLPALVARVVETTANSWLEAACLPRALTVQYMLRRRGIASRLCLGVARDADALAAHAWVEIEQAVIIGGTERQFARVAEFG